MGNIMFIVNLGKDWTQSVPRSQWKVEEEVSWFGGCFLQQELGILYISYMAEWMQTFIRTSLDSMRFPPCSSPNQPAIFMQDNVPSDCKTGKAVPRSWKHWNNEKASPESWSKPDWKSLENILVTKLWLRNPLQSPNCGRDWRTSGPRSHQSSVRDWCPVAADVLKSFKARACTLLIFDCCNLQKF